MKYEGGYVDNPNDGGGPTKFGVTFTTWLRNGAKDEDHDGDIDKNDLKLITLQEALPIAKRLYWDKVHGDEIKSQSIAELLMDWAYMSGNSIAIKRLQEVLGLPQDGVIGPNTLAAINRADAKNLFEHYKMRREKFFRNIVVAQPKDIVFLNGWLRRNSRFIFHD